MKCSFFLSMERSCRFRSLGNSQGSELSGNATIILTLPGPRTNKQKKKIYSKNWPGRAGEVQLTTPHLPVNPHITLRRNLGVFRPWRAIWKPTLRLALLNRACAGDTCGRRPIGFGRNLTVVQDVCLEQEWSGDIRHRLNYFFLQSEVIAPFFKIKVILLMDLALEIFIA